MSEFKQWLIAKQQRFNQALPLYLDRPVSEFSEQGVELHRLCEAMRYSSANGGKRVRPVLLYASAEALGYRGPADTLDAAAAALEMLHCYSLVHDDLPAMDDDDLRRGQPTCHIAFDEATAILVGDALQCRAFEVLASLPHCSDRRRLQTLRCLSAAAGARGMVGGQAMDLAVVDRQVDQTQLEAVHRLKTGALISAAVEMGAILGGASASDMAALRQYSRALGLCFQVQDDILDIESSTEVLGKTQGADVALNKPTYPALMGLENARQYALQLRDEARQALHGFAAGADPLRQLADYIVNRDH